MSEVGWVNHDFCEPVSLLIPESAERGQLRQTHHLDVIWKSWSEIQILPRFSGTEHPSLADSL